NSMRRVPDSTVTAAPLDGVREIGPTVASKESTRSAGASPILTCDVALCPCGGGGGGVGFVGVELLPPPQATLETSAAAVRSVMVQFLIGEILHPESMVSFIAPPMLQILREVLVKSPHALRD